MAYDLYAFDLFAAPRDRHEFLDWISRAFRSIDGPLGGDASRTSPALQAWQADMRQSFPPSGDPHAFDSDVGAASYRFTQNAVLASLDWANAGPSLFRAKKAAQARGVGLFDACGHDASVWMMSGRGRWEIVHKANDRAFG